MADFESNSFSAESPDNHEQKTICCLVLDTSGSMEGEPISQLNEGLKAFHSDIESDTVSRNRLEVALITFNSTVEVIQKPSLIDNFSMPSLVETGTTKLVDGVMQAIDLVEQRKDWYRQTGQPYLRPWIILITDGAPDDDQDMVKLGEKIKRETAETQEGKKYVFLALGVQGANMDKLKSISNPEMLPMMLEGLKFSEFFKWLSASMAIIASSKDGDQVGFPAPTWMQGFRV